MKTFFWVTDHASLKIFTETLRRTGNWSSPGGRVKKVVDENIALTIFWYYGKQGRLSFRGQCAEMCKESLLNVLKSYVDRAATQTARDISTVVVSEADLTNVGDQTHNKVKNATLPNTYSHDCRRLENGIELDGVKLDISYYAEKV